MRGRRWTGFIDEDGGSLDIGGPPSAVRITLTLAQIIGEFISCDLSYQELLSDILIVLGSYFREKDIDAEIDERAVLSRLMVIAAATENGIQLRNRAVWAYAHMIRCRNGNVGELALELGHLQTIQQLLGLKCIPACLFSLAGHCDSCTEFVIASVNHDFFEQLLNNEDMSTRMRVDGMRLLVFLAKRAHDKAFLVFVVDTFFRFCSVDRQIGLTGLSYLAFAVEDPEIASHVRELGIFEAVTESLQSSEPTIIDASMRVVEQFHVHHMRIPLMNLELFMRLLSSDDERLVMSSIRTISEIISDSDILDGFRDLRLMDHVITAYSRASFAEKEAICVCLAALAQDGTTGDKHALVDAHALSIWLEVLEDASDNTAFHILNAILTLIECGWKSDGTNLCGELDITYFAKFESHPCSDIRELAVSIVAKLNRSD